MKKILAFALALCLTLSFGGFAFAEEEPIHVAFFAPRTGDLTNYGDYLYNGVMLKVNEVNANGGINGRPIEVTVYDDQGSAQEAASIAQIIVDDPKYLAAIGSYNTPCVLSAATVFDEAHMVQMVPCAGADSVHLEHTYTIRQQNTNSTEFEYIANIAINDLGAEKVGIIYIMNDSGIISMETITKTVEEAGKEVVLAEGIMPDQISDYTSLLAKFRDADPDIICMTCDAKDAATIVKQSKMLGMADMMWLSTGTIYTDEFLEVGGDAVNGVYTMTTYFAGNPDPRISAWTQAYMEAYDGATPNYFATGAYECMSMLVSAFENGCFDRESIYEYLLTIREWDGDTGLSVYDETRNVRKAMTILQVVDGEFQMANLTDHEI